MGSHTKFHTTMQVAIALNYFSCPVRSGRPAKQPGIMLNLAQLLAWARAELGNRYIKLSAI